MHATGLGRLAIILAVTVARNASASGDSQDSLDGILAISDTVAVIKIEEISESHAVRRKRGVVHEANASFTWSTILRDSPFMPINTTEKSTLLFERKQYDPPVVPGVYLVFLIKSTSNRFRMVCDRNGFFLLDGESVRVPLQWTSFGMCSGIHRATWIPIADAQKQIKDHVASPKSEQYESGSVISIAGLDVVGETPGYCRLVFSTKNDV